MNFRTTYILFAVLFAFLGVMLLSQLFGTRTKEEGFVLPSVHDIVKPVKADDIETVEIQRFRPTAETLRFYKDSKGVWRCKEPDVRLVSGLVRQIIDQVMAAKRDEQADLTNDLTKFGLDHPAAKITLIKAGGEREWWLDVGDQG
jgi:regulatory protein YycI of two-component signal transduction system YycFG